MRILLHSRFHPNIGGVETVAALLAHEWHQSGAEVIVVSDIGCLAGQQQDFPFPIFYRPSVCSWVRLLLRTDLFVHMNISLKALWPLLFVRRPFVAVHHGFYECDRSGRRDWRERLKLRVMPCATNIAVSDAVRKRLPVRCVVIPNPVDAELFHFNVQVQRPGDLVFVGRLVSDKGVDLLLTALALLRRENVCPQLTIVGDGPERLSLEKIIQLQQLTGQVRFTGALDQKGVARELRQHQILVVPSLVEESFGVVALEGGASGCVVLGSDGGGLPEAIGPTGITFRRGDASDLAAKLKLLLAHPESWVTYRNAAAAHVALHAPARVAQKYLEVFASALKRAIPRFKGG